MPDTNTYAKAEAVAGVGALLAGFVKFWGRITGTSVLRAQVTGHTHELAEQAAQMRDLQESVSKVREDVARIPTKDDLTGAVRDLTAALERMADRQAQALERMHQRLDEHLDHHPGKV